MWEEAAEDVPEQPGLSTSSPLIYVAEAIRCLWKLHENLLQSDEDTLTLGVEFTGCQGRKLFAPPTRVPLYRPYTSHMDVVSVERSEALGVWRASNIDLAVEMLVEVFERFNWTSPPTDVFRGNVEALFDRRLH